MFRLSDRRIFRLIVSVIIPILGASLLCFDAPSDAWTKPFNYTATGTFEPTLFVFPDGTQGDSITLQGTSTDGPITVHEWATGSSTQKVFPPCVLSNGEAGTLGDFADSFEVITFQNGDVLLQELVSGAECNANVGPPVPFDGTLIVTNVGGTGKFADATGTETLKFAGQYYVCGTTSCVGYVQHNETGTVTTR